MTSIAIVGELDMVSGVTLARGAVYSGQLPGVFSVRRPRPGLPVHSLGGLGILHGLGDRMGGMNGIRTDAWLWAARFFKTRTLAKKNCDLNRVLSNGMVAKAAREVRIGDMLRITTEGGEFEVQVLGLSDVRGPASAAQKLYEETGASKETRLKVAAERRVARDFEILPAGRPSKRDRRRIIQFRGRE